jgi:glycosyltransferase involved in cell wall biosynthesis
MRVGLEASVLLSHRFTGVPRYICELARAFAELDAESLRCTILLRLNDFRKRSLKPHLPWPTRWYLSGPWPALPRCDVFHGLSVRLPRISGHAARVCTIHDLSPFMLPSYGSARGARNARRNYALAARHAHRIIAVSASTKSDFLAHFDIAPERIAVVHLGLSSVFLAPEDPTAERRSASEPPYFVAFGGNPRKNLAALFRAFGRSAARGAAILRVVGPMDASTAEALRDARLADSVRFEADMSDAELARLYRGAAGLLYPSLQEGFGLPILEAMACKTPVLTSARSSMAEIAAGHAVLVDPESPEDIAAGIDRLSQVPARALADAAAHARGFTWRRTAEQTLAVYRAALG